MTNHSSFCRLHRKYTSVLFEQKNYGATSSTVGLFYYSHLQHGFHFILNRFSLLFRRSLAPWVHNLTQRRLNVFLCDDYVFWQGRDHNCKVFLQLDNISFLGGRELAITKEQSTFVGNRYPSSHIISVFHHTHQTQLLPMLVRDPGDKSEWTHPCVSVRPHDQHPPLLMKP